MAAAAAQVGPPLETLAQQRALEHYRAGQALLLSDAYAGAADEFRAAVDLDPRMALAHYGLGQSYMGLKSYVQAVQAFTRCRQAFQELARRQVVSGCGGGNYCPAQPVSREQMGVFLGVTFGLTLYGP